MKNRLIALTLAIITLFCILSGCNNSEKSNDDGNYKLKIGYLKGPTGMGMAKLLSDNKTSEKYEIDSIYTEPQAIMSSVISGKIDIAAVPVNLAATIAKKTDGKYLIAAVNTLGVLYIVERGNTIYSVKDLGGKKIIANGQASTPEYVLNYLLDKNSVGNAEIEYFGDASAVTSQLISGKANIAMLPEPAVTTVISKDSTLRVALDLSKEWKKVSDGELVQGCIIVSKEIVNNHKSELDEFLSDYKKSTEYVNSDPASASQIIADIGIIDNAVVAEKAIPKCNIVYIDGDEMISVLTDFYKVLFDASPASIGGKMPDESFYYKK